MTGTLEVMDRSGDTKHTWNSDDANEVAAAKATFEALEKKGFRIFALGADDARGRRMKEFDPSAERLIAIPQLSGG